MNGHAPCVSIGMPVYNGAQHIRTSIESVLAQDFTDFELIISDNASGDATFEICQEYAARDPRVRVYRNGINLGAAPNYNRTLELARGEYFKWQCHDDWCAPEFLRRCVEMLDNDASLVMVYPRTVLVDDDGNFMRYYEEPADASSPDVGERFVRCYWTLDLCNIFFGVMRTQVAKLTTYWHPSCWEGDKVMLTEMMLRGRMAEVPEYLFYRRFGSPRVRDGSFLNTANNPTDFMRRPLAYYYQMRALFRSPIAPRQKLRLSTHVALRFLIGRKGRRFLTRTARYLRRSSVASRRA